MCNQKLGAVLFVKQIVLLLRTVNKTKKSIKTLKIDYYVISLEASLLTDNQNSPSRKSSIISFDLHNISVKQLFFG